MLPVAMNWWRSGNAVETAVRFVVFIDALNDSKDFLFKPLTDKQMKEMIEGIEKDSDVEDEQRRIIELSMMARSEPFFDDPKDFLLLDGSKDYSPTSILNMDFYINKENLSDERYFSAKLSQDVRRARNWNGGIMISMVIPPEHFIYLTGILPHNFQHGDLLVWDMKNKLVSSPKAWNVFGETEVMGFSQLITAAISELSESST